jgi:hypothetical protein
MKKLAVCAAITAAFVTIASGLVFARQQDMGEPVNILVTLEPKRGKTMDSITPQDIRVQQDHSVCPVSGLTPMGQAPMQLALLIDNSARFTFDTEINTLKQFVNSLPPYVEVAVGYMANGMTEYTQNFTADHAAAANSIRLSMGAGGADVSPYDSLTDAVKKWPKPGAPRKEIIMISSGIEGLGGGYMPDNPYVNAGIQSAQKAGVVVYSIYDPSVGHMGHGLWRNTWGQNFLSQLSDETGGEAYMVGFGSPVSFEPFLNSIRDSMQNQYQLTFEVRPQKKSGLVPIRVTIPEKNASIAAPDKVFVKAGT